MSKAGMYFGRVPLLTSNISSLTPVEGPRSATKVFRLGMKSCRAVAVKPIGRFSRDNFGIARNIFFSKQFALIGQERVHEAGRPTQLSSGAWALAREYTRYVCLDTGQHRTGAKALNLGDASHLMRDKAVVAKVISGGNYSNAVILISRQTKHNTNTTQTVGACARDIHRLFFQPISVIYFPYEHVIPRHVLRTHQQIRITVAVRGTARSLCYGEDDGDLNPSNRYSPGRLNPSDALEHWLVKISLISIPKIFNHVQRWTTLRLHLRVHDPGYSAYRRPGSVMFGLRYDFRIRAGRMFALKQAMVLMVRRHASCTTTQMFECTERENRKSTTWLTSNRSLISSCHAEVNVGDSPEHAATSDPSSPRPIELQPMIQLRILHSPGRASQWVDGAKRVANPEHMGGISPPSCLDQICVLL
ncbi:hypothetical protein SISNIDRAFT_467583 [Sistotremastrum niveocremeum HHB9708]|uniref:Uncharacterized protein n=1 Tax=Sistotremastrum niveocremeum HHB9708 TaxID=1314777 RepID=A0A164SNE0_9AGAM|nr:hypothetical protein SISNIDRAFT_467583 [Sistotremastrum niveocremeum HHB9708]